MEFRSVPAVVRKNHSGCLRASPLPCVMTSYSARVGWVCSSSKMQADTFRPCLVATSLEST